MQGAYRLPCYIVHYVNIEEEVTLKCKVLTGSHVTLCTMVIVFVHYSNISFLEVQPLLVQC